MKLRTTTPASIPLLKTAFLKKSLIVTSVVVMAAVVPIQMALTASADQYDAKMQAIQREIDRFNAAAGQLREQANTLQNALSTLQNEIGVIQSKIDLSQTKYDQLIAQIAATEKKITDNQDALGNTIADLYVDDEISPIEMLASSTNIGDYLDKQEFRSAVRDQLTDTIGEIKDLRTQLNQQKDEVKTVLDEQNAQKGILVSKQNEQQSLLAQTQGQEAAYQSLAASKVNELREVQRQQREAIARLTNGGRNTAGSVGSFQFRNYSGNQGSCGGGYPTRWCTAPLDAYVDKWALYSRECVSYAAWAAEYRFGKNVSSFAGRGHAYQWPNTAVALMRANVDNNPTVGSVAITPQSGFTPLGHAMVVEDVYGDGWVRVSQYNFAGTGEYSTMDLKASSAVYVHFQNK